MACTYAGIGLPVPTPEAIEWVQKYIDPLDTITWEVPEALGKNRWYWAQELLISLPEVELGTLYYPIGATRFAIGYFLVTDNILNQIRPKIFSGSQYTSQPLLLDSISGRMTTNMWMLPPRPLAQLPFQNGMYLLTLVDDRYWWWFKNTSNIDVTEINSPTSWLSLFNQVATQLGITISVDPISSNYLTPSSILTSRQEPCAVFLQTLALNVGHRILRNLDGTFRSINVANSSVLSQANLNGVKSLWAGGVFGWLNTSSVLDDPDLTANTPGTIEVSFPKLVETSQSQPVSNFYIADGKTFVIDVPLTTLNIPVYVNLGISGNINKKTVHENCAAAFTTEASSTPLNNTELTNLAKQIATDWYIKNAAGIAMKIKGIYQWLPDGQNLAIIWKYQDTEVSTFIQRPAWNDNLEELNHSSATFGSVGITFPGTISFPSVVEFGPSSSQHNSGTFTIESNPSGPLSGGTVQCSGDGLTPTGNLIPQIKTSADYTSSGPSHTAIQGAMEYNTSDKQFYVNVGSASSWVSIGPDWVGENESSGPPSLNTYLHPITTLTFQGATVTQGSTYQEAIITIGGPGSQPSPGSVTVVYVNTNRPPGFNNFCKDTKPIMPNSYLRTTGIGPAINFVDTVDIALNAWIGGQIPPGIDPSQVVGKFTSDRCSINVVGFVNNIGKNFVHNLLSPTHPDTVPLSPPNVGDLVIGQLQGPGGTAVCPSPALWQDFPGSCCTFPLYLSEASGIPAWIPGTIFIGTTDLGCTANEFGPANPNAKQYEELLFNGSCFIDVKVGPGPATQNICTGSNFNAAVATICWCGFYVTGTSSANGFQTVPNVDEIDFDSNDFLIEVLSDSACKQVSGGPNNILCNTNYNKIVVHYNNGNCDFSTPVDYEKFTVLCNVVFNPNTCQITGTYYEITVCKGRIMNIKLVNGPPCEVALKPPGT